MYFLQLTLVLFSVLDKSGLTTEHEWRMKTNGHYFTNSNLPLLPPPPSEHKIKYCIFLKVLTELIGNLIGL
jgi:hypothetical protein